MKAFFLFSSCWASTVLFSQNVGIGTTTPVTRLHVSGTGANIATFSGGTGMWITLAEGASNRGYIGSFAGNAEDVDFGTYSTNTAGKVHLTTANTPRLTVSAAGNIGIGEVDPIAPLNFASVLGNKISLWGTGANHYGIGIQGFLMQLYTAQSTDDIAFGYGNSTAFTENMRIKGNGNVGIGTSSPNQMLSVAAGMNIDQNDANSGTPVNALRFGGNSSGEAIGSRRTPGANQWGLDFYTNSAQRMSITLGGNVGIGTNTPNQKLQVNGAISLGTTSSDIPGTIRFNPVNNDFEGYDGTQWRSLTANGIFSPPQSDTGSNQQANDNFGYVVKMYDNYLFVGIPNADVGTNANQGQVAIYVKNTFTDKYELYQTITAPDGASGDQFGSSLDCIFAANQSFLQTYYLAIGAPSKIVGGMANRGTLYLFVCDYYTGQFRITTNGVFSPADGAAGDKFGGTVLFYPDPSISGVIIYAAAPAKTVNGNPAQGRVYICNAAFVPLTGYIENLVQGLIIDSPEPLPAGFFGYSIAACPCTYLNHQVVTTNVLYNHNCNTGEAFTIIGAPLANGGRGKIFEYLKTSVYDTSFTPADVAPNDNFGISIGLADKRIYIGASGKQIGSNAAQGRIYIIKDTLHPSPIGPPGIRKFVQTGSLELSNGQANDRFGYYVKAQGDIVLAGSHLRDDVNADAGAVYIYEKYPGIYNSNHFLRKKITDPAGQVQDNLGQVFDLIYNKYVIGVPNWDAPGRPNSGKIIFGSIY